MFSLSVATLFVDCVLQLSSPANLILKNLLCADLVCLCLTLQLLCCWVMISGLWIWILLLCWILDLVITLWIGSWTVCDLSLTRFLTYLLLQSLLFTTELTLPGPFLYSCLSWNAHKCTTAPQSSSVRFILSCWCCAVFGSSSETNIYYNRLINRELHDSFKPLAVTLSSFFQLTIALCL